MSARSVNRQSIPADDPARELRPHPKHPLLFFSTPLLNPQVNPISLIALMITHDFDSMTQCARLADRSCSTRDQSSHAPINRETIR